MHGTPNPYGPPPPPSPPMPGGPSHKRQARNQGRVAAAAAAGTLIVLIAVVAALTSGQDKPSKAKASPTATPSPTRNMEAWEHVPAAQQRAFVAYLHKLDPGLTPQSAGAKPRPLRRAVSVCWDIYDGKPAGTVLHNTAYRYNGGQASVPEGSAKARRILAAVKRWICSSKQLRAVFDARHP